MRKGRQIREILMIIIVLTSSVCVLDMAKIEFFSGIWVLLFVLYNFFGNLLVKELFKKNDL